jgi:hypothetical protein
VLSMIISVVLLPCPSHGYVVMCCL